MDLAHSDLKFRILDFTFRRFYLLHLKRLEFDVVFLCFALLDSLFGFCIFDFEYYNLFAISSFRFHFLNYSAIQLQFLIVL